MNPSMPNLSTDVLVVGAGPGGLYAAGSIAREGFRVLVCEEHATIGDPVHCTGIIASESFNEFELSRTTILNTLSRVRFISPAGLSIDYETTLPEATVVDRGAFDRALGERAREAGAEICTGVRVRHVATDESGVTAQAGNTQIRARLVVLACGASYGIQRRAGMGFPAMYLQTAQRELPAARLNDVEVHFGRHVAPGGFAWAVPIVRPEGPYVRVGVMANRDARGCFNRMLHRIAPNWGVAVNQAVPARLKILPLGSIARTFGNRLLAVGDAAGLVKPTTGGGIYYSVLSGSIAARTAVDGLKRDRLDERAMAPYEAEWRARLGREFEAQDSLRRIAIRMSDGEIDSLFDLAQTDGVMPLVRKTAKFNEHRHLIRALFKHPPARRILFRSVLG